MYRLAPFILQNFKNILRTDPELWRCGIFRPKMAHLPWTIFLVQNIIYLLSTYWPFSLCKILKKFLRRMCHFSAPNGSFAPNKIFFFLKKINNIIFIYLLAPFVWQNFKMFLDPIQSYEDEPFSGPKTPICPEQHFLVQTITTTYI